MHIPWEGPTPERPPPPVLPWCPFVEYEHLQLKRPLGAVGLNLGSDEISGHAPQLLRNIGILIAGSLVFMAKNEDGGEAVNFKYGAIYIIVRISRLS